MVDPSNPLTRPQHRRSLPALTPAGRWLIAITLLRLIVAATVNLAPDETYYWVWSRALQPGYLDHPPMVALWIRLGTALAGPTALGVRLLGPLSALLGSALLADAGERLFPGRGVGARAAVLLNATLMVGVGAVTMTPDTPLLFFAVLSLWAIVRAGERGRWWWLVVGASVGAAMASKYTGVLLGLAVPIWLLWARRDALRSPWLWAGGAVALVVFAPVIEWNWAHGWASVLKQGGRAGDWRPARAAQFLGELAAGQIGLATPGIVVLFAEGLRRAARRGPAGALLLALVAPGLAIFVEHAVGDRVQANWLALLYPPLALAAAALERAWWRWAAGLGAAMTALVYLQAATGLLPLPDPTLRLAGWQQLARDADAMRLATSVDFLASDTYADAAELAWWAPAGTTILGAEPRWRLFDLPGTSPTTGLLLISEHRRETPDPAVWTDIASLGSLTRVRGGVEAERFRVYRVRLQVGATAKILPRPGGM